MNETNLALAQQVKKQTPRDMLLEERRSKVRLNILSDPRFYYRNTRYSERHLTVINEIRDATAGLLDVEEA